MLEVDHIYETKLQDITSKKFYENHLRMSLPLHVVDGAYNFDALTKWDDNEYLKKGFF